MAKGSNHMIVKMALTCKQVLLMIGMLITGSINTISKKAQNDCVAKGYPEKDYNNESRPHKFDHPWFQTLIMFFGETICLVGYIIVRKKERDKWRNENMAGMIVDPPEHLQNRMLQLVVTLPTVCDLLGTSLAGIGLLYVDASVWQMLRGSIIIFAGILSKIFLKRKLTCMHWTGMILTMIGLVLVGCSSIFRADHGANASKTILGIILIVGSQFVSASQMIIEEIFLKKRNLHPLHVVGMEGSYGILLMIFIALPAMYFIPGSDVNGSYENSLDALYQIGNDVKLLIFCFLYLLSIAFYNYFGLSVTRSLTAVHRTLIDACRTMLVWGTDLLIFYAFGRSFGEAFDTTYGLLQVDGFFFLMMGTALYNQLVDFSWIPCLRRFDPKVNIEAEREEIVPDIVPSSRQGNIQAGDDSENDSDNPTEKTHLIGNKPMKNIDL